MKVESRLPQESGMVVVVVGSGSSGGGGSGGGKGLLLPQNQKRAANHWTVCCFLAPQINEHVSRNEHHSLSSSPLLRSTCTKSRCCTCPLASGRCRGTSLSLIDR